MTKVEHQNKIDFPKLLGRALSNIINLDKVYTEGDVEIKRKVISSIFPEKLEFFENHYRTARPNVLLSYIYHINNLLGTKKTGKKVNYHLFPVLTHNREMSEYLVEDLERIMEVSQPQSL